MEVEYEIGFPDYESFRDFRNKCLLEGALAYIKQLSLTNIKTIDELNAKLKDDFERAAAALCDFLRDDLKWAGWTAELFEEDKVKVQCGGCARVYESTRTLLDAVKCPWCGSTEYGTGPDIEKMKVSKE